MQDKIIKKIVNDDQMRREVAKESHLLFFHIYFLHYIKYETAPFQKEIFALSEDDQVPLSIIVAFRGSGKSTIMTLSYPIWAILGKRQEKFVVILSQTQRQARQHLANLKIELETNQLLKRDLGPFKELSDEWGIGTLVIPKYNARIIIASTEQSIRGMRHGPHRPGLIICDDVEDLQSTRTKEGRDKTFQWFTSEVVPLGGKQTKIVVVGNLLHEDSLLMRLKEGMEQKAVEGIFREYPLIKGKDQILWPAQFPTMEEVEKEKKKVGSESAWEREYMLRIISDAERVVHPEWIHLYSKLPNFPPRKVYIGVDLAVSQKESADYTAVVSALIYGSGKGIQIYISPHIINKKMTFPETVETLNLYISSLYGRCNKEIVIETNGFQLAMAQIIKEYGHFVKPFNSRVDKRTRLSFTTDYIKSGKILFPAVRGKDLIRQLTGFGKEKHDDMADAFSYAIIRAIESGNNEITVTMIEY